MATYMLLLKSGKFDNYSPEAMQEIVERYIGWANKLREQGRHRGGEELKPTGRVLRREKNKVLDGPYTETKESVGGFFLIEARDYDDAVEISRGCPHLDYEGEIELREINPH
ncbi:YciI family protein [bacterium]|nr:YciI family protein [bacterium]MCI0602066.1 YciI family protein [bacterium]